MPNAGVEGLGQEVFNDIFEEAQKNDVKFIEDAEIMNRIKKHIKNSVFSQVAKYLKEVRGNTDVVVPKEAEEK